MQKMCSWNLVTQQVIRRLQQDFEVTTQPRPECSFHLYGNSRIVKIFYILQVVCFFTISQHLGTKIEKMSMDKCFPEVAGIFYLREVI